MPQLTGRTCLLLVFLIIRSTPSKKKKTRIAIYKIRRCAWVMKGMSYLSAIQRVCLNSEEIVKNSSKANTTHRQKLLHQKFLLDTTCVFRCVQFQVRVKVVIRQVRERVERRRPNDVTVELVHWGGPRVWTDNIVICRREASRRGLQSSCLLSKGAHNERQLLEFLRRWIRPRFGLIQRRASQPFVYRRVESVEDAFVHDLADVRIVNGPAQCALDALRGQRTGIVLRNRTQSLGNQPRVPDGVQVYRRSRQAQARMNNTNTHS